MKIIILDTTLRDGAQGENINFSLSDKVKAAGILADFGIDYIEAGWPVSNPKDNYFFRHIIRYLNIHSKIVAFCSTRKKGVSAKSDTNLMAVIRSKVKTATVFGKIPLSHVDRILKTTKEENLYMIFDSITFLKKNNIRVIYDA